MDLLETINNEVKPAKIIIIGHSLGCRLVCLALQQLYNNPSAQRLKLDHVIFLAPNVDREEFNQNFKSGLQALVNRLTIYVASDDNVLLLGKLLYNVDSIGLSEQFLRTQIWTKFRHSFITRNSFPERLTWSTFRFRKRIFSGNIVCFSSDQCWKTCSG
jgi:triacylglycerol esterase/lipase EstA (alpha/beta hydrolase family)